MRITTDRMIWVMESVDGDFKLGLTQAGLDKYGKCFVFVPKVVQGAVVKPGNILASMEGMKCLRPLRSPLTGVVHDGAFEMQDTPYEITAETTLFSFKKDSVVLDARAFT